MISLRFPWMLLFLAGIPALVLLRYRLRRRPALRFSDGGVLRRLPASPAVRLRAALPVLYGLGWGCLIIALAQPRHGLQESTVRAEAVDMILLVDVSSSMRAEDLSMPGMAKNRLEIAKEVIDRFIRRRASDRLGLVAFAALPYSVSPLTLDHDWLRRQVDRLSTDMLEDGTAIGSALASAVDRLRDSQAVTKLVILLTDGENNAGRITPENAAQAAQAIGVKVYTVGAGTDGYVNIPVRSPLGGMRYRRQWSEIDEITLKRIAEITGGRYFRAADEAALEQVYDEIDELEKTEIDVEHFTQYEPQFAPFAVAAVLLFALEKLLALTRLGRLPL